MKVPQVSELIIETGTSNGIVNSMVTYTWEVNETVYGSLLTYDLDELYQCVG